MIPSTFRKSWSPRMNWLNHSESLCSRWPSSGITPKACIVITTLTRTRMKIPRHRLSLRYSNSSRNQTIMFWDNLRSWYFWSYHRDMGCNCPIIKLSRERVWRWGRTSQCLRLKEWKLNCKSRRYKPNVSIRLPDIYVWNLGSRNRID